MRILTCPETCIFCGDLVLRPKADGTTLYRCGTVLKPNGTYHYRTVQRGETCVAEQRKQIGRTMLRNNVIEKNKKLAAPPTLEEMTRALLDEVVALRYELQQRDARPRVTYTWRSFLGLGEKS